MGRADQRIPTRGGKDPWITKLVDNQNRPIDAANPFPTSATFSGTVESSPTFKSNPSDAGETPKYGKVDSDGYVGVIPKTSTGSVVPTAAFFIGLKNADSNLSGFVGANDNADAVSSVTTGDILKVLDRNTVFNGTTWDRMRGNTDHVYVGGNIVSGATDAGNPVKIGGKFNSTLPTFSDGQRGDLQIESRGALRSALYNGATPIAVLADNADGAAVSATANRLAIVTRNTVFNGTTWDRLRGDTANGIDVDVTRFPTGTTSLVTTVTASASSVEILPSNTSRKKAVINNDSAVVLYIKEGAAASPTSYTYKLFTDDAAIIDDYSGVIHGIWTAASGDARVTETT